MIEVYTFYDQPTTCPQCGLRTEIIADHFDSPAKRKSIVAHRQIVVLNLL